ncbi:MAG: hypothetical protein E6F94_04090 [Actinobacteria bacterium]|nr:MAG: hypothetical protein E6G38_06365 [Actinomycetota bacterium]TMM27152.1 MAG: hypothetical protein E6F94_04090 [Actinomycetota bacterium]
MASRKQRRRRAKERRHEYEYVYVDDAGREIEPAPDDKPERGRSRGKTSANGGKAARGKRAGPVREAKPPSWNRSVRRSLLFLPLFFIVFSLVNKHSAIEVRFLSSLAYSGLFVPLTYLMDRTAYRTYLRRSGQQPAPKR